MAEASVNINSLICHSWQICIRLTFDNVFAHGDTCSVDYTTSK